jgi:hypothetical protein
LPEGVIVRLEGFAEPSDGVVPQLGVQVDHR